MKSVQSDYILQENDKLILQNLYQNRAGLIIKSISKLTNLKTRTIYKRINILKEKGFIEHIYPIWKIVNGRVEIVHSLLKNNKIFELHNLSYVLKLVKVPDWWNKRKPRLEKIKGWHFKNVDFGKGESNPYQQLINENFVIQTYPESIIIISRKRYLSNSPYEVITEAINDVLDIIAYFEERIKFKLFPSGFPALEIRNNDFNRIKDYLAEHCKKEGRRFLVEIDKHRKVWVDYSEPFGKEANYPEAQERLEKVTKDLLLKESYLPSEIKVYLDQTALQINQVTQNQLLFAKNIEEHMAVLKDMGNTLKEIRDSLDKR